MKPDLYPKKDEAMRAVGIMLLLTIILQGCGHKGPLFLPTAPTAAPQPAPVQPPVEKPESKK